MTFSTIQLRKEVRPLLLPWISVILVGFLFLFRFSSAEYSRSWSPPALFDWILPIGCFLAIPLLGAMSLGAELQHGTFTALLAQPIDRQKLWLQKIIMSVATVLPAAALYLFSLSRNHKFDNDFWLAAVWMVASTAGSVAGTLLARSAIGGLALSSAFFGTLFVLWSKLAESNLRSGHFSPAFLSISITVLFFYAFALVWLGRRMFLGFQSIEGPHVANDLLDGNRFLPRIAADWLRCKPHGAVLNLLRRELHLLRTVWLLGLFSLLLWIGLVVLGILRPNNHDFRAPVAAGIAATLSFAIAILAGALSLGEEKIWGTHSWQLTLPVSPSIQWLVKLLVGLFTSVICAALVPLAVLLVSGWLAGSPLMYFGDTPSLWFYPLASVLITLIAFWTSCAAKGTVPAVVTFFLFLFGLGFVFDLSPWVVKPVEAFLSALFRAAVPKLDPVDVHHFISVIVGAELNGRSISYLEGFISETVFSATLLLLVTLGLMQSRRLFRAPDQQTTAQIARRLLPILALCFLPNLAQASFSEFWMAAGRQQTTMWTETHAAIEEILLARVGEQATTPQRLTSRDWENASTPSDVTRRWLSRSHVVVISKATSADERPPRIQWPYEHGLIIPLQSGARVAPYSATIVTESGHTCNLRFWAEPSKSQGVLFESCQ